LENIDHLRFVEEKKTFISEAKYRDLARHTLQGNDVLFSSFVGENVHVCLFSTRAERAINKADCFCVRTNDKICSPQFLVHRLACQQTFEDMKEVVHGATRPRINLSQLRNYRFELPSMQEQAEIVQRIQSAFAWIDRLMSETTIARKLIDHLDQAILAKAFRGELVPQDPNDEPASALLERIRAERQGTPRKVTGKHGKRRPQSRRRVLGGR
jgi:type I restriction enzyme S subunit